MFFYTSFCIQGILVHRVITLNIWCLFSRHNHDCSACFVAALNEDVSAHSTYVAMGRVFFFLTLRGKKDQSIFGL